VAEKESVARPVKKQGRTVRLSSAIVSGVIILIVGVIGGMRADDLIVLLGNGQNKGTPSSLDFSSVQQVYDQLRQKYDGKLDVQKLIDGAKKGMVAATGDPYTVYFTKDEAKQFFSDLNGKFSGIGAELDKKSDQQLIVVSTLDDSPARKAGLQAGDAIAKVNDEDTSGWSVDQAVSKIRGDKGTTVKLTIVRDSKQQEFSIVRDEITTPSVTWNEDTDNIGYMRIASFADDTASLTQKAAQEFKDKGVKAVVLDLRGDGGGYLTAAQAVASLWLPEGKTIVQERTDTGVVQQTLKASGNALLSGLPTTVLVDGGSASASEIVSGALHDNGVAKLVGVKTFGKGSVQDIVDLPGGAELKVTIAKWYTPNGKNINKEGIQPDVNVPISDDDLKNSRDPQKDKAFELVKNQ